MDVYHRVVWEDAHELTKENLPWEKLKNQTVLVTGASGFIGAYLVYSLLAINDSHKLNIKVLAMVRNADRAREKLCDILKREDLVIIEHDVSEPFEWHGDIGYIVHTASVTGMVNVEKAPIETILSNVMGAYNMLTLAKKTHTKHVCALSSGAIYEDAYISSGHAVDDAKPECIYANAKLSGEGMIMSHIKQYGTPVTILRICSVYGQGRVGFMDEEFKSAVLSGSEIVIRSDGQFENSRLYSADAAFAILCIILNSKDSYVLDLPGDRISLEDWAKLLVEITKSKSQIKILGLHSKKDFPVADTKMLEDLGWRHRISLREGATRYLKNQ